MENFTIMKINVECKLCYEPFKLYRFEYELKPRETTFQLLYDFIDTDMAKAQADIDYLSRISHIFINGEEREPLEAATIQEVVQANSLRDDELLIYVTYGGIGASEELEGGIRFEIREKEDRRHKPHIHISMKGIGDVSIQIGSTENECKIIAGEKYWKKYKNKDRKALIRMIINNHDSFLSFYNDYRERYIRPKRIEFVFKDKTYKLEHGSCVYMD